MATLGMVMAMKPLPSSGAGGGSTYREATSRQVVSFRRSVPRCVSSSSPTALAAGRTRIHRLIEEEGAVLMPGCYDALSAAIVEKSGFSAGFISGYALSASLLGKPDFGLLTPPEMAETARFVCAAAPLIPIIADADTGGGNSLNVQRTVKDLIAAGAAGCFLEDQAWPKKCGHMRGKQVIPAEEHAVKIASARDAIGDADFFLVARTDARATSVKSGLSDAIARANLYMEVIPAEEHAVKIASARDAIGDADFFLVARTDARATSVKSGLSDAIARANLYMEAGADACFVEAPRDDDELREIGRRTNGYRVCNMLEGGVTPLHSPQELKEMGFHLIVHPLTTLYASARALIDILKLLKEAGTTKDHLEKLASFEEFNKLIGLESWFELEARYSKLKISVESKV